MPAELVGTAYVRIRAITAGLASDIKDGVDKGVKDADVDKAGEKLGGDLGGSTSEGFGKSLADGGIADGLTEAFDAPEVHKAATEGGEGVGKDVTAGVEKEHKRKNPFSGMLDALKGLSFDKVIKAKGAEIDHDLTDVFKHIDIDMPSLDFDIPGLKGRGEKAGGETSKSLKKGFDDENKKSNPIASFGESLSKLAPKPINWIAIFGPTTFAPMVAGVISGAGFIVEALGFIVTAAAGAGVAVAGIAAVAAPGFAVLLAAFKVQTKQLEKFKAAAKKLLKPWEQVGVATQEHLLPGIQNLLESIQHLIPFFVEFGGRMGEIVGTAAKFAGGILQSKTSMEALETILQSSEKFFINLRTAALNLIDALLPFLRTVAPLGVQFSESLKNMAIHLADLVKNKAATGELQATFQTWYERAELLASTLGNVFIGLWNILQIASTGATPFFDKIAEGAKAFADWTKSAEGQNAIKKFFDDIQPVLDEVWDLLKNVFNLIVAPALEGGGSTALERLATALHFLNTVLENPITAQVVPYLLGIATGLSAIAFAGKGITALSGLGTNLLSFGGTVLTLAKIPFQAIALGIRALGAAMEFLAGGTVLGTIGAVLVAVAVAAGLVYVAFKKWDDWVMPVLRTAADWFDKLALPLKIVVGAFAVLLSVLNPVVWAVAIAGVIKNWDAIWQKLQELGQAIKEFIGFEHLKEMFLDFANAVPGALNDAFEAVKKFITELPAKLEELATAIVGFVTTIPEKLAPLGEALGNFFSGIPGKIKDALITGLENLPTLILDAIGGLFELGQNLLGLIADGVMYAVPKLLEIIVGLPGDIIRLLTQALPTILHIGVEIIGFILKGLASALPRIFFFMLRLPVELATLLRKGLVELVKLGVELIAALFRGIVKAGPRIGKWFSDLPENILSMLQTAVTWLYEFGGKLIDAILNGITNTVSALFDFFVSLPGLIVGVIGDVLPILFDVGKNLLSGILDGAKSFLGSLDEFFGGLPGAFVDLIVAAGPVLLDIGGKIIGWVLDGIVAVAQTLWDWFTSVPGLILDLFVLGIQTIMDIGGKLITGIIDGIVALASGLWDWFLKLPGAIWDAINSIISEVWDIGKNLILQILEGVYKVEQDIWNWFLDLPSTIWDTIHGIIDEVWGIGSDLIKWVLEGIVKGVDAVWEWFKNLPHAIWEVLDGLSQDIINIGGAIIDWILEGLGDLGSMLLNALKTAWNWVADKFSITIPIPVPGVDDIKINLPKFDMAAMGGVFPGSPLGIPIIIGEGGRSEAVVPMTRPSRALAVMQEAGLDKLVLDAYMGGTVAEGSAVVGDTTMLHIDTAIMTAPVDADMIVQKVTSAYNRLAS